MALDISWTETHNYDGGLKKQITQTSTSNNFERKNIKKVSTRKEWTKNFDEKANEFNRRMEQAKNKGNVQEMLETMDQALAWLKTV